MTKKTKKVFGIGLVFLALCAVTACIMLRTPLTLVRYEVETDFTAPVRIVHLTDLHSWSHGENNQELIQLVKEQSPDLILMTGDMMDREDENPEVVCSLISALKDTAPVYFSYGNHEFQWMQRTGTDLRPILTEAGATVLDIEYLDTEVNGQAVRLGGYYNYYYQPHMLIKDPEQIRAERAFGDDLKMTDRYIIFLNHIATTWLDWNYRDDYSVDLVLTGHYHGGQVRLPFIGGLIAPYVGWFPEYTEGIYYGKKATVVLSTGLGSSPGIPRVNNPPQLVVVDLIPKT